MSDASAPLDRQAGLTAAPPEGQVGDYIALLKPRVMRLVVFTAAVGLVAAPVGLHPVLALAAVLCIAVGAGASGALNMWWDADIDARMSRTVDRPIPSGRIAPGEALAIGVALSAFSVMLLFLVANPFAAGLLAFTIFFYAVIYSMWLKRSTPQNIVIGGAAGAFPPVIGWAAATGGLAVEPLLMFALIFLWTPPHFWALALFRNDDYRAVDVPMLPAVAGDRATRHQILGYSLVLAPAALALGVTSVGGPVYLISAVVLNGLLLSKAWRLWRRDGAAAAAGGFLAEKRFFGFSILYLFAHFVALLVEATLRALGTAQSWGLGSWPVLL